MEKENKIGRNKNKPNNGELHVGDFLIFTFHYF